ncbi:hypothetical protein GCM10010156_31490 [Planobispora rosea]|uniref:Uncharacterized protein n=1 Tax=Planobispora rosea TaxID=35762 RepID=A0A8J3RWU2_PLARO|nr:hypothetical protein GCM10010156_31490 [Planobispora rosea]GIH83257.1 hypothetical protein Pro02_16650 [Planobispora rosea]
MVEELDGDLLAAGAPPQIDDALAALAEPPRQLECAQPLRIPRHERLYHVNPRQTYKIRSRGAARYQREP